MRVTADGAYDPKAMAEALAGLRAEPIPGLGATPEELVRARTDVFDAGFLTPLLTLRAQALDGNVATMAAYCAEAGVELARTRRRRCPRSSSPASSKPAHTFF